MWARQSMSGAAARTGSYKRKVRKVIVNKG